MSVPLESLHIKKTVQWARQQALLPLGCIGMVKNLTLGGDELYASLNFISISSRLPEKC